MGRNNTPLEMLQIYIIKTFTVVIPELKTYKNNTTTKFKYIIIYNSLGHTTNISKTTKW